MRLFIPDSVSRWWSLVEQRLVSASVEARVQLPGDCTMNTALKWIGLVPTSFLAPVSNLQLLCFSASVRHTVSLC